MFAKRTSTVLAGARPARQPASSLSRSPIVARRNASTYRSLVNSPRFIFLGWTALVFLAGYGYYSVKSRNTAKAQEYMRKARYGDLAEDDPEAAKAAAKNLQAQRQAVGATERSPAQALVAAISRQKGSSSKSD